MNLAPINQTKLFGHKEIFNELTNLFIKKKLPNKILLSGQKGIGKCTLAYHLINYFLSYNEENPYDSKRMEINSENKSFRLTLNKTNPNLSLIDVSSEKRNIEIDQIRTLISNFNKSSFNLKPRFILIDNIEYLNNKSINALLKFLEEPSTNTFFILIYNNTKILPTLISRCLIFKIYLTHNQSLEISNKILNKEALTRVNKDLINYYITPGKIYNLIKFSEEYDIDLSETDLKDFLNKLINERYYKKDTTIKFMIYEFVEFFLRKKNLFDFYSFFLKKISDTKTYNLDEETLLMEFQSKILNE